LALSALERAYAAHDLQLGYLGVEQHFDSLRSEPRFQELIRKVGLTGLEGLTKEKSYFRFQST
jgi:hypothetical protein